MKNILSILPLILLAGMLQAFAGDDSKAITPVAGPTSTFRAGGQEVELLSGNLYSLQEGNRRDRPELNYAIQAIRFGWMLNNVHGPSFWRGNEELLVEAFGGEVFKGPGNGLGGAMLILRHNFVQDDGSRIIPYIQGGAGGLGNDIYSDQAQTRVGAAFEFTLHLGLGVRWRITDHWTISTEAEYRHISNADTAGRNSGLDSVGGVVGFNYLF